jgi:tetratricopeptide (TPR) repeat protein
VTLDPLVSILRIGRNAARSAERLVESLLDQSYPRVEIIVHDLSSTAGTETKLEKYRGRLDLASDSEPRGAHLRALGRCRGTIIGLYPPDSELTFDAIARAVEILETAPRPGAIYSDLISIDARRSQHAILRFPPWDLERVFSGEFTPSLCGAFFRRSVLESALLDLLDLPDDCTAFSVWARVGGESPVRHVEPPLARCTRPPPEAPVGEDGLPLAPTGRAAAIDHLAALPAMPEVFRRLHPQARGNAHLSEAIHLFTIDGRPAEGREQLAMALAWTPGARHATAVTLDSLKWSLRRARTDEVLAWLDLCLDMGFGLAAVHYSKAIALFDLGELESAAESERRLVNAPALAELLEQTQSLLEGLLSLGRASEADYAIDVLDRLGSNMPGLYCALATILANLGRYPEALAGIDKLLRSAPSDAQALRLRDLIQLMICAAERSLRRALASGRRDRPVLSLEEAVPLARAVWRNLVQPDLAGQLSAPARAPLRELARLFQATARRCGFPDLAAGLETLVRLGSVPGHGSLPAAPP